MDFFKISIEAKIIDQTTDEQSYLTAVLYTPPSFKFLDE